MCLGFVGRAQACLRGLLPLLHMASDRLLGCPLSGRRGSPHPAGSLTARVAKTVGRLPCRPVLATTTHLSVISSLSGLSQLKPRTLAAMCPLHHPSVLPNPDRSHIYSVDSFIQCFMQSNGHISLHAHTESHALFLFGHTPQWLTVSFSRSGYLSQRLKTVVWPSPYCSYISISSTSWP